MDDLDKKLMKSPMICRIRKRQNKLNKIDEIRSHFDEGEIKGAYKAGFELEEKCLREKIAKKLYNIIHNYPHEIKEIRILSDDYLIDYGIFIK